MPLEQGMRCCGLRWIRFVLFLCDFLPGRGCPAIRASRWQRSGGSVGSLPASDRSLQADASPRRKADNMIMSIEGDVDFSRVIGGQAQRAVLEGDHRQPIVSGIIGKGHLDAPGLGVAVGGQRARDIHCLQGPGTVSPGERARCGEPDLQMGCGGLQPPC